MPSLPMPRGGRWRWRGRAWTGNRGRSGIRTVDQAHVVEEPCGLGEQLLHIEDYLDALPRVAGPGARLGSPGDPGGFLEPFPDPLEELTDRNLLGFQAHGCLVVVAPQMLAVR